MCSPLQQVFGLLPLGDLGSAVVVVLLPRRADMLRPVVSWVLVWTDNAETSGRHIFVSIKGSNRNEVTRQSDGGRPSHPVRRLALSGVQVRAVVGAVVVTVLLRGAAGPCNKATVYTKKQ